MRVLIGVLCSVDNVPAAFCKSLFDMERPCPVELRFSAGYSVADIRNALARQVVEEGFSHLLMLDMDMVYPRDTLTKLLDADKDIVGGLYMRRHSPPIPLFFVDAGKRWEVQPIYPPSLGILKTAALAGGGVLIRKQVFEKMTPPYFRLGKKTSDGGWVGEDIYFSFRARDIGYELYCRSDLIYGHLAYHSITPIPHSDGKEWTCERFPVT